MIRPHPHIFILGHKLNTIKHATFRFNAKKFSVSRIMADMPSAEHITDALKRTMSHCYTKKNITKELFGFS